MKQPALLTSGVRSFFVCVAGRAFQGAPPNKVEASATFHSRGESQKGLLMLSSNGMAGTIPYGEESRRVSSSRDKGLLERPPET